MTDELDRLLSRQDGLLTRRQALAHLTRHAVAHALTRSWQVVTPGIYATFTGELTCRQRQRAGLLLGGDLATLSDISVIRMHGGRFLPADDGVHVLVPHTVRARSRAFIRLRRTTRPAHPLLFNGLPTAPLPRALVEFALRVRDQRTVRAVLADCVQRQLVALPQLADEAALAPTRGCAVLNSVVEELTEGVRSAPEAELRDLVLSSDVLPTPLWNPLLRLPDGTLISPDALIVDSALVQETNGRLAHGDEDPFEDMQERHGVLTAAGFEVLHASPRQIRRDGARVLGRMERCHVGRAGRGLPPGVVILRTHAHDQGR